MLGQHKKQNTAPPKNDDIVKQAPPSIPTVLPPLRTFIVRQERINDKGDFAIVERQIDAHGLAIDEERMISFIVFFWLDVEHKTQPAQTAKLVLNADAWLEVEEINPLFPELVGH